jgi:hypothetical protein
MKEFVILARRKGAKERELLAGPEMGYSEQRQLFKGFRVKTSDEEFESVEHFELVSIGKAKFKPRPVLSQPQPVAPKEPAAPKPEAAPGDKPSRRSRKLNQTPE